MKSMQYSGYGDPSLLRMVEMELPSPAAGQILVKVNAAAVNPIDWKLRDGSLRYILPAKFPSVPGFDLAGKVMAVGPGVDRFDIGDRIYACLSGRSGGACAEYAVVDAAVAAPILPQLDFFQAAAIPLAALTALQSLRDLGELHTDQRLLIVGGSGGVGHFAIQIGKTFGAHVTAVCSTGNVGRVAALGADQVIDYTKQSDFSSGEPYDVVLDCVVEKSFRAFRSVMSRAAVYVAVLFLLRLLVQSVLLRLYSKQRIRFVICKANGDDLALISKLVSEEKLQPLIDRVYPLQELAAAHRYSQSRRAQGKIVIDVAGDG
jgi:NADPH:quinone reductase-like Zn-dependent oxidoreductase